MHAILYQYFGSVVYWAEDKSGTNNDREYYGGWECHPPKKEFEDTAAYGAFARVRAPVAVDSILAKGSIYPALLLGPFPTSHLACKPTLVVSRQ
jgi:hypothetical protein